MKKQNCGTTETQRAQRMTTEKNWFCHGCTRMNTDEGRGDPQITLKIGFVPVRGHEADPPGFDRGDGRLGGSEHP